MSEPTDLETNLAAELWTMRQERDQLRAENLQLRLDIAEIRRQHQREANEWKTDDELELQLTAANNEIERLKQELAEPTANAVRYRDTTIATLRKQLTAARADAALVKEAGK